MTKKVAFTVVLTILSMVFISSTVCLESTAIPETLYLEIFFDGVTSIEYDLKVDPMVPAVNITLIGQIFETLTVIDRTGLPLDYTIQNDGIMVFSLGADQISISYVTQDLTRKENRSWTLEATVPINATIILPQHASIITVNPLPLILESFNDQILMVFPPTTFEVTYVVGVLGTKEHATIVLDDAEKAITDLKDFGIIVTLAETKLQQAIVAFDDENFVLAEELGIEAKTIALQINQTATEASMAINEAITEVSKAENEGRSNGLSEAQFLLDQANETYATGAYEQAFLFAVNSKAKASEAVRSFSTEIFIILMALLIAVSLSIFLIKKRKKIEKKERIIDLQKIFRTYDLMKEEKDALSLVAKKNGEAFESEIYQELKLPRTSTWRMIRRLEKMNIIKIEKFRKQNLIKVKKRFEIKQ